MFCHDIQLCMCSVRLQCTIKHCLLGVDGARLVKDKLYGAQCLYVNVTYLNDALYSHVLNSDDYVYRAVEIQCRTSTYTLERKLQTSMRNN